MSDQTQARVERTRIEQLFASALMLKNYNEQCLDWRLTANDMHELCRLALAALSSAGGAQETAAPPADAPLRERAECPHPHRKIGEIEEGCACDAMTRHEWFRAYCELRESPRGREAGGLVARLKASEIALLDRAEQSEYAGTRAELEGIAGDVADAISALTAGPPRLDGQAWCSGCGSRWVPDGIVVPGVVNLCGDCWRKVQPVVERMQRRNSYEAAEMQMLKTRHEQVAAQPPRAPEAAGAWEQPPTRHLGGPMSEPITAYVVRRELHAAPTPSERQRVIDGGIIELLPGVPSVRWAVVEYSPDEAREEGRREILREIAKMREFGCYNGTDCCHFCGQEPHCSECQEGTHLQSCLWLRARQATKETP